MSYSSGRILLSSQREGQVSRFRAWVMVVVPLAAILFQVYVPLFFQFLRFLEMPLLVVVYFALMRRNQIGGLLWAPWWAWRRTPSPKTRWACTVL